MRNRNLLQLATKNKSLKILEVPLLNSRLSEHTEQLSKEMLNSPNLDAEFSCNPECLGLDHHSRLLELPDAKFNILIQ